MGEQTNRQAAEASWAFVLSLSSALQSFGTPAHRLEEIVDRVSARLGVEARFFSTPTAVLATWGDAALGRTALVRVRAGEINLEKLAELHAVAERVAEGDISARGGQALVEDIGAAPPGYGPWLTLLSFSVVAGSAAIFFGGGWREALASLLTGLVVGALGMVLSQSQSTAPLFELMAATFATAMALLAAGLLSPLSPWIVAMAGLVVLLPGFTLTVAVSELGAGHLISGTARMLRGLLTLLALGFGLALGGQIGAGLAVAGAPSLAAPGWAEPVALVLASLSFVVLFRARWRDAPVVVASGLVAFYGAGLGGALLGPQMGAFIGALAVGLGGRLYERFTERPDAIVQVPGVMLLVPGSIGFRSVGAFLEGDALGGVEAAFHMGLVAVSLMAGLLAAVAVDDALWRLRRSGRSPEPRRSCDQAPNGTPDRAAR